PGGEGAGGGAIMSADEGKSRRLTDEDRKLWGHFTRSVAPLRRQAVPAAAPTVASSKAKSATHARPAARPPTPAARTAPGLEPFDRRPKQPPAPRTQPLHGPIALHRQTQNPP